MKLWKGRFTRVGNADVDAFNASIEVDKRLYAHDIAGSVAHALMLSKQGILSDADATAIVAGLEGIRADIEAGRVAFTDEMEDIHMAVESLLTERIGEAGKRLHTARSRNDQVALDLRLFLKGEITEIARLLDKLVGVLADTAEAHRDTVMPGYTHLQRAQPVTLAFHLLAYCRMFLRDADRFADCLRRTDVLPLGSGAMSGVTYDTDREFLRDRLGFARVGENAADAVSDRDFAIEFLSCAAVTMMHLSRFCEEIVLWSSSEFGFVELDDAFSTGSSIMPQKKNPDIAELIRGKTGRVYGDMMSLLTIMKGLPLAYNKDMQEDKRAVFDATDTLKDSLAIFTAMLASAVFRAEATEKAAKSGFLNATDAADYLVGKGVPFRDCHEIIGRIVLRCIGEGKAIEDLSADELRAFSPHFGDDIHARLDIRACIAAKRSEGSTSADSVLKQLEQVRRELKG